MTLSSHLSLLLKRLFDIIVAVIGLVVLVPFFLYVIILIKRAGPGPIFYRGRRAGLNGKVFHILKFRTMHPEAATRPGPKITAQDDPRITSLGRWLRQTKLNELPQLWNVLVGEMSIVGPRPEDPDLISTWPEDLRREILTVRPGITSPASVQYRNEEDLLQHSKALETYLVNIVPSKMRLDQLYVRNRSFWLDLDTILWTIIVLMPRLRRYDPGEALLFWGPLNRLGRRHLSWLFMDLLVSLVAMTIAGLFWRSILVFNIGVTRAFYLTITFAFILTLINYFLGVNRISWTHARAKDIYTLLPGTIIATLVIGTLNRYILPHNLWLENASIMPTRVILTASVLSYMGFVFLRYRSRFLGGLASQWVDLRKQGIRKILEHILIVGSGESGQITAWILQHQRNANLVQLVGYIDDDPSRQNVRITGVPVIGRRGDIPALVRKHDIGIIFFSIHNIVPTERAAILKICIDTGCHVILVPNLLGIFQQALLKTRDASQDQKMEHWVTVPADSLEGNLVEIEAALKDDDSERGKQAILRIRTILNGQSVLTSTAPASISEGIKI